MNKETVNALDLSPEHLFLLKLSVELLNETQKNGSSTKEIKMNDGSTIVIKSSKEANDVQEKEATSNNTEE